MIETFAVSDMPHYAKHHASENRKAIKRSLVTKKNPRYHYQGLLN